MKKIMSVLIAAGFLIAIAGKSMAAEFVVSSGMDITLNFPYGGEVYSISITNHDDIDIYTDYYSGSSSTYADDRSFDINHFLMYENYWEWAWVVVDNLPPGTYTVTVSGTFPWPGNGESYLNVFTF